MTAKIFKHGGSQAIHLPKAFRFAGSEVEIEKRGDAVVLRAKSKPQSKTRQELAEHLERKFPGLSDWPDLDPLSGCPAVQGEATLLSP